ncbi:MAG: HAD family phosphatase [Erysipelothrix sp.]|nr:HAD family phosphatase [Erysipelothrix sp.]
MIKAIICDLDETLLDLNKQVSAKDIETIRSLKDKGISFVPATGRPYFSIKQTIKDLGLLEEDDISITYNGGMIHRNHDHKILDENGLTDELAGWLFDFGVRNDICMHVYVEELTYHFNLNDEEKHHCRNFEGFTELSVTSLDELNGTPIIKMLYQDLDIEYLRSIEAQIPQKYKDQLEISYSSGRYLEFNPKGVSKGEAIKHLADILNIDVKNMLSIGDNFNDMTMIQTAGKSGAPKNAVQELKDIADYVSSYTHTESTVSDIINHFIKD